MKICLLIESENEVMINRFPIGLIGQNDGEICISLSDHSLFKSDFI